MEVDLVVKNGLLVIPEAGITKAALAIKEETIVGICDNPFCFDAKKVIDAQGNFVLPGIIQPHAHLGRTDEMEDYATETRSAAIGGVTTFIEFHRQREDYTENFSERVRLAREKAYVDFSFHFHITSDEQMEKIPMYVKLGVASFKFVMTYKGKESRGKGVSDYNDGLLYASLLTLGRIKGTVACIHAENEEIIAYKIDKQRRKGRDDLLAWSEAHPSCSEAESIHRVLYFSKITQCPLYIVHMTTKEGLRLIIEHRRKGLSTVYSETCPQYLTHNQNDNVGKIGKFTPALQRQSDNDALWTGLHNGDIDTIGVDQIARTIDPEERSIWERSNTPREAATALSVLISEGFHKRNLAIERIAKITSYNAARIFNIYPGKGTLNIGSDADLVIVDVNRERKVSKEFIQSYSNFSIYEGWTLKGWPVLTICRGKTIMADGAIVADKGWGKFIEQRP